MKYVYIIVAVVALVIILVVRNNSSSNTKNTKNTDNNKSLINEDLINSNPSLNKDYDEKDVNTIYLAGGCFWGVEAYMKKIDGIVDAVSGYANGNTENPSYEDVLYKNTGHAEAVEVKYDPKKINLEQVLLYFFKVIDPTTLNKQGNDRGTQYRSGVYYTDEAQIEEINKVIEIEQKKYKKDIVVEVFPIYNFYKAEEYHQDYLEKNPGGYCHINLDEAETGIEEE